LDEYSNEITEYAEPEREGPGITGALSTLAIFSIAAVATSTILKRGSVSAAKALVSRVPGLAGLKGTNAGGSIEGIASHFLTKTFPTLAEHSLTSDIKAGNRAYLKWAAGWNRQAKALEEVKYLESGMRYASQMNNISMSKVDDFHFSRLRSQTADFFKRPGLSQRAIGLGVQTTKAAFAGNLGAYVADQSLNIFNETGERNNPAWYNLPGHALNFAKFSAETLPFGIAFAGGFGYTARMGKEVATAGMRTLFHDVIGRPTTERALARTAAGADWIFKGLAGLQAAITGAMVSAAATIPKDFMSFHFAKKAVTPSTWIEYGSELMGGWKRGFAHHKASLSNDFKFDDGIRNLYSEAAHATDGGEMLLRDFYTRRQKNRSTTLEYMFGLNRKVDFSSELSKEADRSLAKISLPGGTKEQQAAADAFRRSSSDTAALLGRMQVQVQPGVYSGIGGRSIDLRPIHPRYLMNKVANVMHGLSFRIPGVGTEVNPFEMFLLPNIIKENQFEKWNEGSVFLGTNRTARQRTGLERILSSKNPNADSLINNGWYDPSVSGGTGLFAGGGFYHNQDGAIRRLHTPRMTYKIFAKGQWGLMTDTMSWLGGRYPIALGRDDGSRNFGQRMKEKLDLDETTNQGIFRRIGSHVRKFVLGEGNPHPNNIYDSISRAETGGSMAANYQSVARGISSLVDDSLEKFSEIKTKRYTDLIFHGTNIDPNRLDDWKYVFDVAREQLSASSLNPMVRDKAGKWNIKKIVDRAGQTDDYGALRRLMHEQAPGGRRVHDSLIDFLSIDALSRRGSAGQIMDYTSNVLVPALQRKGDIDTLGASALRIVGFGLAEQSETTFYKQFLASRDGTAVGEKMKDIVSILKTRGMRQDVETATAGLYRNPLKNFITLEDTPYVHDRLINEREVRGIQNSPWNAVPWTSSGRMLSKELKAIGLAESEYEGVRPKGAGIGSLDGKSVMWSAGVRRITNILNPFDMGLNPAKYTGQGIWQNIGGPATQMLVQGLGVKRAGALAGMITAYSVLDSLVDVMPGIQNTPLCEGLTSFGADQFVKARMGVSWVADTLGITSGAKYLEGLFPGMIDSPAMRVARGVIAPIWLANQVGHAGGATGRKLAAGLIGGVVLGGLQGFGMFDMTKNTQELKEVYSGREEVPIKKGRWWELGSSNYSGQRIRGWYPNWYARLKSKYMSTPEGWGSPLEQVLYKPWPLLDFNPLSFLAGEPHHYAYQHYYSRPYPETGSPFYEFPFVGPTIAATVGKIIAPPKQMHSQEMYAQLDKYGFSTGGGFTQRIGTVPNTTEMARAFPVSTFSIRQTIGNQINNIEQAAGLWGFGLQTATQELGGFQQPYEGDNVLENAGEITSMRRQYYDKELGGLMGFSEAWRRFLPKRPANVNRINPLQNRMPKWLPVSFRTGDAYAKTPWGELSLPGQGYTAAHDVEMTYPVSADILGLGMEETVRKMLSLGRPEPIGREELEKVNTRIKAAAEVYEPYNDISGTYDGIIRKGRRAILQKIKNFNSQELNDVIGPTETDISEVNFYMRMAGVSEGIIQYRVDGVPTLAYPVKYDEQRFQKDLDIVSRARRKAADLYAKGVGFEGEAYSHLDRANILATVAPYSNEFKRELGMAKKAVKLGQGDKEKLDKVEKHAKAMKMSQEFYPNRFLGKIMAPSATFNNMSLNENMKAAAEYSTPERALGALWEGFNSLNHPLDKFHSYKTPIEAYKADTLYGRRIKMWQNPGEHWVDAMERGFMSKDTPWSGYLAGFVGGYSLGPLLGTGASGAATGFLGGAVSAAYGSVHGMYRKTTSTTYIPGTIKEIRKVNRYFDQMNYQKNLMLYDMTGEEEYLEGARSTMMGLEPTDMSRQSWSRFYRATPYQEKPYVIAFLKETDPNERKKILELVPSNVGDVLATKWAKIDGLATNQQVAERSTQRMPPPDWTGWAPEVNLDDVELKTVQNMGMEAHDFGLGWYEQQRRVRNSTGIPGPININSPSGNEDTTPRLNQTELKSVIEKTLRGYGLTAFVSISPSYSDNMLTVIS
jgi:hypothetical protein